MMIDPMKMKKKNGFEATSNGIQDSLQSVTSKKTTVAANNATCTIIHGDSRVELAAYEGQVDLIVTSPPYADARRNHYDSVHPDQFVEWFITFHEPFYKALKPAGSLIINIKDKVVDGVRHRYVWHMIEALCSRGWFSIDDYLWHKTNPMPGYWPTRFRDGWEYCFHLAKSKRPFIDQDAVRKPIGDWVDSRLRKLGENDLSRHNSANASGFGRDISKWVGQQTVLPTNVLSIALVGKNKGHPAVFPVDLPLFFIKLLCPQDGLVMDPFGGSGTTGIAALSLGRSCVLIDNNLTYCEEALRRLKDEAAAHHDEVRFVDHENQNGSTHVQNKLLDQRQNYESSDE
jgi:site-specific DNA-methyltransferase (adenine-specific)/site-specific DNA-methyltransferase (cytosine-N4-specific)